VFSLYDVEQFLKEAGAEKVNERAVVSLERELQDTVNRLVENASVYANYAGRSRIITLNDVMLSNNSPNPSHIRYKRLAKDRRKKTKLENKTIFETPKIMLVNKVPVIKEA